MTRAWELLVGSGLALWLNGRTAAPVELAGKAVRDLSRGGRHRRAAGDFRCRCGASARRRRYPGYSTLVPVLAAAALIGTRDTLVHRYVLSVAAAVFIGLISYPLYLWHYPMMAYGRIHFVDGVPVPVMSASSSPASCCPG